MLRVFWWFVPRDMEAGGVRRVLLDGDGGGGVLHGRPAVWVVVEGVRAEGVLVLLAVEGEKGVQASCGVTRWVGVGGDSCLEEGVWVAVGVLP